MEDISMRQIQLSQAMIAVLDDEDHNRLSRFHWCYRGERNGNQGYAIRHAKIDGKKRTVYLHREIMGEVPEGCEVIFKNYDRLDCRRENLVIVTKEEARQHHRVRSDCKAGAKGISYDPAIGYTAAIHRNGHRYAVGTFANRWEAEDAYEEAVKRENPDLYQAPEIVQRRIEPEADDA
jgi:hypothetical protein